MAKTIKITSVYGVIDNGELVYIVVEGNSSEISHILLTIRNKKINRTINIIREVYSGEFNESFEQDTITSAQCECGELVSISAYCLANSSIFDTWNGLLNCIEIGEEVEIPGTEVYEEEEFVEAESAEVPVSEVLESVEAAEAGKIEELEVPVREVAELEIREEETKEEEFISSEPRPSEKPVLEKAEQESVPYAEALEAIEEVEAEEIEPPKIKAAEEKELEVSEKETREEEIGPPELFPLEIPVLEKEEAAEPIAEALEAIEAVEAEEFEPLEIEEAEEKELEVSEEEIVPPEPIQSEIPVLEKEEAAEPFVEALETIKAVKAEEIEEIEIFQIEEREAKELGQVEEEIKGEAFIPPEPIPSELPVLEKEETAVPVVEGIELIKAEEVSPPETLPTELQVFGQAEEGAVPVAKYLKPEETEEAEEIKKIKVPVREEVELEIREEEIKEEEFISSEPISSEIPVLEEEAKAAVPVAEGLEALEPEEVEKEEVPEIEVAEAKELEEVEDAIREEEVNPTEPLPSEIPILEKELEEAVLVAEDIESLEIEEVGELKELAAEEYEIKEYEEEIKEAEISPPEPLPSEIPVFLETEEETVEAVEVFERLEAEETGKIEEIELPRIAEAEIKELEVREREIAGVEEFEKIEEVLEEKVEIEAEVKKEGEVISLEPLPSGKPILEKEKEAVPVVEGLEVKEEVRSIPKSFLLPTIEITSVRSFSDNGNLVDIVVEGTSTGCTSIVIRITRGKVKYYKIVSPSFSGDFRSSFEQDIKRSSRRESGMQITVNVLSLANSSISDTWSIELHPIEKGAEALSVEEMEAFKEGKQVEEEKAVNPEPLSTKRPVLDKIEEKEIPITDVPEVKAEKEGIPESFSLPTIEITKVKGLTYKGDLVDIVVDGISTGCKNIVIKIQYGPIKFYKIVYPPSSGEFKSSFEQNIRKSSQRKGGDQITVNALSLANTAIFDTWAGTLHCEEK